MGYSGDTASFQFVGRILGIPHATGYPTYILLNHLFVSYLPFGSHAWRANLLSAIFAVAACVVLRRLLVRLGLKPATALILAAAYGVTRTFWSQAVVAEVYTLNILFMVLVLDRLLIWRETRRQRDLLLACAVYAVSFGNHVSMIFLLPGIVAFVWLVDASRFRDPKTIAPVLLLVLLGASQYLYLFLRTSDPGLRYSELFPGGPSTVLAFMTGSQFQGRMFAFPFHELLVRRIPQFGVLLVKELLPLVLLIPVGMIVLRDRALQILIGSTLVVSLVYGLGYDIADVFVYFLPTYLMAFLYVAIAVREIGRRVRNPRMIPAALALMPIAFLGLNLHRADRSRDTESNREVMKVLDLMDRNAVLLSPNPTISEFFWYHLIGEGVEREKGIHLVHHVDVDSVAAYMRRGATFFLPEERRTLPPGLTVYDWEGVHRDELETRGCSLEPVSERLYRVVP